LCLLISYNTIFHSDFGYGIRPDDEVYKKLSVNIRQTNEILRISIILSGLPFLKYIPVFFDKIQNIRKTRTELCRELTNRRRAVYDPKNPETYLDHMFALCDQNKMTEEELIADIGMLFAAAADTIAVTLEYAILLLAKDQDAQEQVYNELKNDYNKEKRVIGVQDVLRYPLLRAFVYETLRISSATPLGFPRYANEDFTVNVDNKEYLIPKHSRIIYNIEYIHKVSNKEHWRSNDEDKICFENWIEYDPKENKKKICN